MARRAAARRSRCRPPPEVRAGPGDWPKGDADVATPRSPPPASPSKAFQLCARISHMQAPRPFARMRVAALRPAAAKNPERLLMRRPGQTLRRGILNRVKSSLRFKQRLEV